MTCIVGLKHEGKVFIGGDSAGVAGYDLTIRADEKVFKNGDFVMGFTSSFRMGQLLRYKFKAPYHKPEMDTFEYMVTEFIDSVRACLKNGGYSREENGEETGGQFLVGYRGELFNINPDFQVGCSTDSFDAVGSGSCVAKGSLFSTRDVMEPGKRIMDALTAAERFNAGVRGPFNIVHTKTGNSLELYNDIQ